MAEVVDAAGKALGPVGVSLPVSFTSTPPADLRRDPVIGLESAGYRAIWTNEAIVKDALVQLALLLPAGRQMVSGTRIANIWAVAPESDRDRAKATAREAVSGRLGRRSYSATMASPGYSAREIAEVGDRLVNAVVAHGNPEGIAVNVREHLAAGADHVALPLPVGGDFATGVDQLAQVALAYPA